MKVSAMLTQDLRFVPDNVKAIEATGYDECFSAEFNNDPFLPLAVAAEHHHRLTLSTSIAVAFARSPMTLAYTAWDLQQSSGGHFILGVGSQIKPHITRRFSMPWSRPAARMREYIEALRAIWRCWESGDPATMNFDGNFYCHNLMTPMFMPPRRESPAPKVRLAAVGPVMSEVAGAVADGIIAHGFTTEKYLREVTLPAVERGLAASGRRLGNFDISCPVMVVTGQDEETFNSNRQTIRAQLGFYASTPAYRPVLDVHGWGDLQPEMTRLSKQGEWQAMGELITDEMLNAFAIVCEDPRDVPGHLRRRYGGLVDVWQCGFQFGDQNTQAGIIHEIQSA